MTQLKKKIGKSSKETPDHRRDTDGKLAYEKILHIIRHWGRWKWKQQGDATALRTANIPNTDNTECFQDVERRKLSLIVIGMENATATLEDRLAVS